MKDINRIALIGLTGIVSTILVSYIYYETNWRANLLTMGLMSVILNFVSFGCFLYLMLCFLFGDTK